MKTESHKSSTGMDANVFAMLVYVITIILGWIPYLYYAAWVFPLVVILVIEKDSIFVKRHAAGGAMAVSVISGIIGILLTLAAVFGAVKAYQYEDYTIPLIGGLGEKLAAKLGK